MKFHLFLTSFVIMSIFVMGQSQTIKYTDIYGEDSNENDDWYYKTVEVNQINEDGQVSSLKTFDREGTLIKKQHTELIFQNHVMIEKEKYFPEYNCKSISKTKINLSGETEETNQCLSMEGDLIFSDKVCEELSRDFNNREQFDSRLQNLLNRILEHEEGDIKFRVIFSVSPKYTVKVININNKSIEGNDINLTSQEQSIIQFIENTPKEYFEGRLKKIAGKTVETLYKLPIIYRNE